MANPTTNRGAVVITGASTGIGAICAQTLDREGFRVFAGVRRAEDGERLRATTSARLTPIIIDVTDDASIREAEATIAAAVGDAGLAGLINNAGIAVAGPLEFLPIAELRHQLEVNVIGQIAVTQAFLPLIRRGHGRIVNIGSISGKLVSPLLGAYGASKHAMEALTDALRMELQPWGILVSIIEPGATRTPIWEKSLAAGDAIEQQMPPQVQTLYGKAIAATRKGAAGNTTNGTDPAKVAAAVLHALTAAKPKIRYPVGRDARIGSVLARLLPDRTRDRLIAGRRKNDKWR